MRSWPPLESTWNSSSSLVPGFGSRAHRLPCLRGITVFEVDSDGRIQTVMSYWDPAAVLISLAGDIDGDDLGDLH